MTKWIAAAVLGGAAGQGGEAPSRAATRADRRVLGSGTGRIDTASTAELERRALDGRAGDEIRALVAAASARRLVRVTQWPVAAVADGDVVYVNAAWLVA